MNLENQEFFNETSSPPVSKKVSNRIFRFLIGIVAVAGIAVVFIALTAAVYFLPFSNPFVRAVTSFAPYPVALVNTSPIFFKDFYVEWDALQFSLAQAEPAERESASDEERRDQIIDVMIDRLVVRKLADKYGLEADSTKIQETLDLLVSNSASEEEFYAEIKKNLGWDKGILVERAIKPMILAEQVKEAVHNDRELQQEAQEKISGALERLRDNEDFSTVAKEVSEDGSAGSGGDIGHLTVEEMPEAWLDFVTTTELNAPSEVIDVGQVYTVIMVTEKVEGGEETQYNIKVIVVYKYGLNEAIDNFLNSSKIWKFLQA